jgi:hypothetical protein
MARLQSGGRLAAFPAAFSRGRCSGRRLSDRQQTEELIQRPERSQRDLGRGMERARRVDIDADQRPAKQSGFCQVSEAASLTQNQDHIGASRTGLHGCGGEPVRRR